MRSRKAAFIHSPQLEQYQYPPDFPFRTDRAAKTRRILLSMDMLSGGGRSEVAPEPARRDTLAKFHTLEYLDALQRAPKDPPDIEALRMGIGTADCPVFEGMYEYAALACGASLKGARLIIAGEADVAFNPSGGYHHAHSQLASGFCYINDVVLACMEFSEAGRKVALVDVDAHHADGVQAAFYDRSDVMTISLHQTGRTLFPGTGFEDEIGTGKGEGFSVNVPLPVATHDEAYMRAFREIAVPLIGAYSPDVIVVELGMDALAADPLTHMNLTNNAYAEVVAKLLEFDRPILATGGGGYHVENTARGWALAWCVLCGEEGGATSSGGGGASPESTDRAGGLRDRALVSPRERRDAVDARVSATIETVKGNVFAIHGL